MKIMNSFAVAVLGAVVCALPVQAATIAISGTPSAFTFNESSTLAQPNNTTAVTASQVVTFDKVQLGPDEELTGIEILVNSDFTTSLTITNNTADNAGVFFSAEAIQTATASPSNSDQLSDPNNSLTVGAGGGVVAGATETFIGDVQGLQLRVDLDINDFIATGPGQTVDVLISAVFNVTTLNVVDSNFQPVSRDGFSFDWNFVKNDFNVTANAETVSTLVPVPSSLIMFALGLVAVGFRLRKLSA